MALRWIVLVAALCQGFVLVYPEGSYRKPDGSHGWEYYTKEGADAAATLESQFKGLLCSWREYVEKLKSDNNASVALTLYDDTARYAANANVTACVPSNSQYRSSTAHKIVDTVDSCADFTYFSCGTHFCTFVKLITNALIKVQTADNDLGFNRDVCFSLRTPEPPSCVESERKLLVLINEPVSREELAKIRYERQEALFSNKKALDLCVENTLKNVATDLQARTQSIIECIDGLKD
uniref:Protein TsetseEP domain-containing protein n=1 Tax=Graphocephala atropunctata TaxID=36148 RepID=A0A1B6LIZ7_9HEMI